MASKLSRVTWPAPSRIIRGGLGTKNMAAMQFMKNLFKVSSMCWGTIVILSCPKETLESSTTLPVVINTWGPPFTNATEKGALKLKTFRTFVPIITVEPR